MPNKKLHLILIVIALGSILFSLSLLALVVLPGHAAKACMVGSNLTIANLVFNAFMAFALAYLLVKPFFISAKKLSLGSALITLVFGSTTFCGACLLPVISVASLSAIVFFFSNYHLYIKALLLLLVFYGFYKIRVIEKQGCKLK